MAESRHSPRLEAHPTQIIDRSKTVEFEFGDAAMQAHEGDTIASALYAAGVSTFSRSFKYHRPRGLLCVAGRCPNCLVTVDGVPNVPACTRRVQPGMKVRHQNAWPSLDRDFMSVLDRMDRFMPVGFYYKTFHRPKLFWRLAQPIIRRIAGLGALNVDADSGARYHHQHRHAEVAVVGGGPAGIQAALAAAGAGARVTLIDDQPSLGGSLRFDTRTYTDVPGVDPGPGFEIADQLAYSVQASSNIEVLSDATAFGLYQDNLLGILTGDHLVKLRAKRIVVATGSYEVPLVFGKNDLPGVMLTTGAQRLMRLYGVKPGEMAVIATNNDAGYYAALDLLEAGVRVTAVVDSRPEFPRGVEAADSLKSRGILILTSQAVARAEGKTRVESAAVIRLEEGRPTGEERRFDCDTICMSGGFQPASSLLYQSGAELRYDESLGETVPQKLPPSMYAAGEITGIHDLAASVVQGRLAGTEAAASLGRAASDSDADEIRRQLAEAEELYRQGVRAAPAAAPSGQDKKQFVCFCEDITASDIKDAIDEGFDDIQTLKRYSTVDYGPVPGQDVPQVLRGHSCPAYATQYRRDRRHDPASSPAASAPGRPGRAVSHSHQADPNGPEAPGAGRPDG